MAELFFNSILHNVTVYGSMIFLGIFFASVWSVFVIKRHNDMCTDDVILIETYSIAFAMLCAKLLYLAVNINIIEWSRIFEPEYFMSLIEGGFVFYGGFLGGAASLFLVYRLHKVHVIKYMEVMIPALPLAQGLGRIGCYFAGCCYGIPYNGVFHVVYHNNLNAPNDMALFPVQLAESVCCFLLAIAIAIFVLKHDKPSPIAIYIYVYGYSIIRFIVEFFRYDSVERGILGIFSTSQWISIGIILTVTAVIIYNNRRISKT